MDHRVLVQSLDPIVLKTLRKNPRRRYPCADRLARELHQCLTASF